MKRSHLILILMISAFLSLSSLVANASQKAEILSDSVIVFQSPGRTSQQITTLQKGAVIYSSSSMVRDFEGSYWYKVLTKDGAIGYVAANDVLTTDSKAGLQGAQIGRVVDEVGPPSGPWNFLIRVMGMGGGNVGTTLFEASGEGEVSVCLPFKEHGYLHRFMSVGAAYYQFPTDPVVAGALILRIYTDTRAEPEFRIRFGQGLNSGFLMTGFNGGVSYPFSLYHGVHVSGFLEAGSLFALTGLPTLHIWASAGLGLHF